MGKSDTDAVIHLRLPREDFEAIASIATAEDRSMAYVLRTIVHTWLTVRQPGTATQGTDR